MSKSFFRICSILYRLLLVAAGIFIDPPRFYYWAFFVLTFILLTGHQLRPYHRLMRWMALCLVVTSAAFSVYLLDQHFTDIRLAVVLGIFLILAGLVAYGIIAFVMREESPVRKPLYRQHF